MSITRSLTRPITRKLTQSLSAAGAGGGGGGFTPASLFASGEQGVWYDPSDLSTMWQDTAGTVPAAVDSTVARIDDKSGRGNNATQSTGANRPTLRESGGLYYLEFDGTNDIMTRAAIAGSSWTFCAGAHSTSINGGLLFGNRTASTDRFGVRFDQSVCSLGHFNGAWTSKSVSPGVDVAAVITGNVVEGSSVTADINETPLVDTLSPYSNSAEILSIGAIASGSSPFTGRVYGIVLRAATTAGDELDSLRQYLAAKSGVTLP